MRTFFMGSRGKGVRSLWVFLCSSLLLRYYVDLNDGRERFCYASSFNEGNSHGSDEFLKEFTSQTPEDGRPSSGDPVFRLPIRRSNHEWASFSRNVGFPSLEERVIPGLNELSAESYLTPNAGVTAHPEPVASIPVCVKDFVELLLEHAFDVLVHNQQLYLSTGRQRKVQRPGLQREENDFEKGREETADSVSDELVGGQQIPEGKGAKDLRGERLAEHVNMSILGLMAEPYQSLLSSGISAWRRGHMNNDNNETKRDKNSSPSFSSVLSSPPQTNWYRESSRLLTPQKLQNTDQVTVAEGLRRLQQFLQSTVLLSHLENNLQIHDLTALLRDIGRVALSNEPEDAAVYLSLLTQDGEAMALWRAHVIRHVFEHFTFSSVCSIEPPAVAVVAAEGDADDKEERPVPGANKEKENKKAKQMQLKKRKEGLQTYSAILQRLRDAAKGSALISPDAPEPRGTEKDKKEEKEESGSQRGEDESERRRGEEGNGRGEKDATGLFRSLLNADWKGIHKLLLKELQEQFWMSRPASSTAALQMIQRASDKNMESGSLDEEREDDKEPRDINEEKAPGIWTPEVSIRFRFVSMKDAQRTMGTFLTSSLHPELGFPVGTKLPPQKTTRSNSKATAVAADIEEEDVWQDEIETNLPINKDDTEQVEEWEIPEHFDAREAFPICKDIIGHVRDQGNCGSCWAFSSTTSFNDRLCIKSGGEMRQLLSPQHTTSCCSPLLCASFGCNGGEPGLAWRWFHTAGVVSGGDFNTLHQGETCWPYEIPFCNHHANSPFPDCAGDEGDTKTPQCRSECEEKEYTKKFHPFAQDLHRASRAFSFPTRQHAKRDIMRAGSISAAFMVYEDFLNYKEGVYKHVYGLPLGGHAVKIIGWGVEGGEEYWLMVNSWNSYWGENGLVKFRMGEAGVDEDLLAGDVVWKPQVQKLAKERKSSTFGAKPSTATYREL